MQFTELCEKYNIPYRTTGDHTSIGWVNLDCPYCGPNTQKFHLGYRISGGRFSCWKCGPKLAKETFGLLLSRLTPAQLKLAISALPVSKAVCGTPRTSGTLEFPPGIDKLADAHKAYLKKRNHYWKTLEDLWGVQGIDYRGLRYAWRLFIPFHYKHEIVSWTTRTISDDPEILRYLTAMKQQESVSHKELLYGYDYAKQVVVVVEGVFDVWRIGPGAVGLLGTRVSKQQIEKIARFPVRYVCLDQGAERYSQKLVEALHFYEGETYEIKLDAKDPDSCTQKELKQIRKLLV